MNNNNHSDHRSSSYEERWDPVEVEECCNLWDLTEKERNQLLQLKEEILVLDNKKDNNNNNKDDANHDDDDRLLLPVLTVDILKKHWKNDPYEVVRFLKEFQHTNNETISTIASKFRHSISWRIQNKVDSILQDYTPPALYNYFPMGVMQGKTFAGDPIYIERTGAADTLGLLQRFGKEEMIQQAIWGKELLTRGPWIQQQQQQSQQQHWRGRRRIKQFVSILDLKGLNRHHLHPSLVPVGQAVTRLVQDNYPGIAKRILVIRAPFFFRFVWNIFKHFVDPHVKELIEIATEQETPDLLRKYMDLSVLPPEIVGADVGKGTTVSGYQTIWEGGPIPSPTVNDWKRRTPIVFPPDHLLVAVAVGDPADPAVDPDDDVSDNKTTKLDTPATAATSTTNSATSTSNFASFDFHQSTPTNKKSNTTTAANPATEVVPPTPPPSQKLTSPYENDDDDTIPPVPGTCSSSKSWESLSSSSATMASSRRRSHAPISISILQTPPPPNRAYSDSNKGDSGNDGGLDSCRSWESLTPQRDDSSATSGRKRRRRRMIQQAWTVTPGPQNLYYNTKYNNDDDDLYDDDDDLEEDEVLWSESNLKDIAQPWNLNNESDLMKLRMLRDSTRDIHHWKNNPYELIRFYVDADGNVDKTESKFRKMIIWRMENQIDDYHQRRRRRQQQQVDDDEAAAVAIDPLFHYLPICVLKGLDKEGDPIYIDRIGSCEYYPLLRHFGQDAMIHYITVLRELNSSKQFWQQQQQQQQQQLSNDVNGRSHHQHQQPPSHQKSFTVIVDLEGLNVKHLRPALLALLKRTLKLSQDNYPGWVKRILVIREPPIFKLVWSITKKFFPPQVRSLIEFSTSSSLPQGGSGGNGSEDSNDYMKLLDKYVDREVLPSVVCPESTGQVMPGYYENVKLEGGPIPHDVLQKAKKEKKKMASESTSSKPKPSLASSCVPPPESPHVASASWSLPLSTPPRAGRSSYCSPPPTLPRSNHNDENDDEDDDSDSWRPSTPVTTTHLLLGKWDHDEELEESTTKPQTETTERNQDSTIRAAATPEAKKGTPYQWQSPMFKYTW